IIGWACRTLGFTARSLTPMRKPMAAAMSETTVVRAAKIDRGWRGSIPFSFIYPRWQPWRLNGRTADYADNTDVKKANRRLHPDYFIRLNPCHPWLDILLSVLSAPSAVKLNPRYRRHPHHSRFSLPYLPLKISKNKLDLSLKVIHN